MGGKAKAQPEVNAIYQELTILDVYFQHALYTYGMLYKKQNPLRYNCPSAVCFAKKYRRSSSQREITVVK